MLKNGMIKVFFFFFLVTIGVVQQTRGISEKGTLNEGEVNVNHMASLGGFEHILNWHNQS